MKERIWDLERELEAQKRPAMELKAWIRELEGKLAGVARWCIGPVMEVTGLITGLDPVNFFFVKCLAFFLLPGERIVLSRLIQKCSQDHYGQHIKSEKQENCQACQSR